MIIEKAASPEDTLKRLGDSLLVQTELSNAGTAPAIALQTRWQRAYVRRLLIGDAVALVSATMLAATLRFGTSAVPLRSGLPYTAVALLISALWLATLFAVRAYEPRFLATGSEEYKRLGAAALRLTAMVAITAVAFRLPIARGFVLLALGLGTSFSLIGRFGQRRYLYRQRRLGASLHRVLVVGTAQSAADLIDELRREPLSGFNVVAACVPASESGNLRLSGASVPIAGCLSETFECAQQVMADTIAVASSPGITAMVMRRLAWQLEGTGIDLIVAPSLTNVAGPRISIRPVAGLPLLHVEEPEITGVRYLAKELIERTAATIAFLLALPLAMSIALAVKLTSPGPVLFRQTRVGRNGDMFNALKFRSMHCDAETRLLELRHVNDHVGGPLFKIRQDPRITGFGRWLRHYSLDELPQLWNVIRGDMALVGPRPPLPHEVADYELDVKRRLLVKPGMTGLWQVSGRSDLSWEDSVRLDLYYVENWSLALDLQILFRTVHAVLTGRGAY